jgi:iron complex outermembrane receptor protein
VQGVEGGITFSATDALTLYTTIAFIDSEITEVNATDATSLPGDQVDYVPKTSFTMGGQYEFNWTSDVAGFVRVDLSHREHVEYTDRTTFPAANVPQESDPISLLDARIGAKFGKVNVELFGTNLTNENKWIDPYHAWTNANRTRPRTVGLLVGVDFN